MSSSSSSPILHLTSSIQIHAPLDAVWSALTDTTTWAEWNRFVPGVTIREQPPSPLDDHTTPTTTITTTPAPAPETETTPQTTTTQPSQTPTPTPTPPPPPPPPTNAAAAAAGALQKGTRMTFHVNMHPAAASTAPQSFRSVDNHVGLVVTEFLPPSPASHPDSQGDGDGSPGSTSTATPPATRRARITWANDTAFQGRVMAALLSAERVHELVEREVVDASSGSVRVVTEVTNWEVQEGYLAYVVKWMFGRRLEENFRCWVEDLKGFVEQQL